MIRSGFAGHLLLAFAAVTTASSGVLFAQAPLDPNVQKQMRDIYTFKASFTPAEAKLSSNLVLLSRQSQGKLAANMTRYVRALEHDASGKFAVEVVGYKTAAFADSVAKVNAEMASDSTPASAARTGHIRAQVNETQLLKLAQQTDVTFVREAGLFQHNTGSVLSQGAIAMGTNRVLPTGVTGQGIKIGILSDSALPAQVASLITSGDLPADVLVVPGQAGPTTGENEGTAMMEIIHDLAPDAKLFFATADNGEDSFAANIRTLRNTYGCDIIVDDVSYFDEGVFQDSVVAQAVNDVTASGALYFSSAANSGNLSSGTSGTWEGDFTPGGTNTLIDTAEGGTATLLNFGTVATPQTYDVLKTVGSSFVGLQWSDPLGGSSNDYDMFLLNPAGTSITAFSTNAQTGTQDPFEYLFTRSPFTTNSQIVVALYSGLPRAMHIDTERGTLSVGTSGATFGHNAGASTFTTAAVYWGAAHRGLIPFTGGPTNPDETFSSDGPRKIFYNPDGSPITPGNYLFSTSGGKTLIKPDAAGADGVVTKTVGFNPFFGTSAAAPHVAAVAALVKSANPTLTNTQIRNILTSTTLDNMAAGVDRDSGFGIVTAQSAVAAARAAASTSAATTK